MDKHIERSFEGIAASQALGSSVAAVRRTARADHVGHSGVQPWSAGDVFPAVIARVERYDTYATREQFTGGQREGYAGQYESFAAGFYARPLAQRLNFISWELNLDGVVEHYASYEDAHAAAKFLIADIDRRVARKAESNA